jgi:hypothetical protein
MIVFDLKCAEGHVFEAWFANSGAFEDQRARALVACPFCGGTDIAKAVMAPNVAAKGNQRARSADAATTPVVSTPPGDPAEVKRALAAMARLQAEALAKSEWVGRDFDRQARAMDDGEIDRKTIHGEVTPDEAKALIEDGVGVMPLPFPVVPPAKRN